MMTDSDWILDSRSAYHLCREREMFSTYAAYEELVRMANNKANKVIDKGTIQFCMANGRFLTLAEVRYVSSLRKNLISIGMLDSKGYNFTTSGGNLRVFKENKKLLQGMKTRGRAILTGGECPDREGYCQTWVQWY